MLRQIRTVGDHEGLKGTTRDYQSLLGLPVSAEIDGLEKDHAISRRPPYMCGSICGENMYLCRYTDMHSIHECMYLCMYVSTYVRMYVCAYVRIKVRTYVCMDVCMYV